MPPRLLGFSGLLLAVAAVLFVGFSVGRLRESLMLLGADLPFAGTLLVSYAWLAVLMPLSTAGLLLAGRPEARRPLYAFVAGIASVLLAVAWVGFGALLPLSRLVGEA
jgi:hypothetical protein